MLMRNWCSYFEIYKWSEFIWDKFTNCHNLILYCDYIRVLFYEVLYTNEMFQCCMVAFASNWTVKLLLWTRDILWALIVYIRNVFLHSLRSYCHSIPFILLSTFVFVDNISALMLLVGCHFGVKLNIQHETLLSAQETVAKWVLISNISLWSGQVKVNTQHLNVTTTVYLEIYEFYYL